MDNIENAYRAVFDDIILNGSNMFKGKHDARAEGADKFMYGIQTVMEHIAFRAGEERYESFMDMFLENVSLSQKRVKQLNETKGLIVMKDLKYKDAWDYLEMCLVKGIDIPKEVLYTLYELVKKYYSEDDLVS